jgi:nicotinamidase-related amidase
MNTKAGKKKRILSVILIITVLIIAAAGILVLRMVYLAAPTKGVKISEYEAPKGALLVIDIQNDTLSNPYYKSTEAIMEKINNSVNYALRSGIEVIYIKQDFHNPLDYILSSGLYKAGSEGSQLSSHLETKPGQVFSKYRSDAFSTKDFEKYLINKQIDTLYLVGADASACVYKTALGAKNRGYDVTILKDALFSISEKVMAEMMEQYLKDGINTVTTEALFK